jgi:large subunit ribosomal protein L29
MKIKELMQISKEDLLKRMKEEREKLRLLRFDLAAGKVKNVKEVREIRKDIARIQTLLKI